MCPALETGSKKEEKNNSKKIQSHRFFMQSVQFSSVQPLHSYLWASDSLAQLCRHIACQCFTSSAWGLVSMCVFSDGHVNDSACSSSGLRGFCDNGAGCGAGQRSFMQSTQMSLPLQKKQKVNFCCLIKCCHKKMLYHNWCFLKVSIFVIVGLSSVYLYVCKKANRHLFCCREKK